MHNMFSRVSTDEHLFDAFRNHNGIK